MYDSLWEDHPKVKQIRAESKLDGMREDLVAFVEIRFPELKMLAHERIMQVDNITTLKTIRRQIFTANDEDTARRSLEGREE